MDILGYGVGGAGRGNRSANPVNSTARRAALRGLATRSHRDHTAILAPSHVAVAVNQPCGLMLVGHDSLTRTTFLSAKNDALTTIATMVAVLVAALNATSAFPYSNSEKIDRVSHRARYARRDNEGLQSVECSGSWTIGVVARPLKRSGGGDEKIERNGMVEKVRGEKFRASLPVPACPLGLLRSEPRGRALLPPLSQRESAFGSAFSLRHPGRAMRRAKAPLRRNPNALPHRPQG